MASVVSCTVSCMVPWAGSVIAGSVVCFCFMPLITSAASTATSTTKAPAPAAKRCQMLKGSHGVATSPTTKRGSRLSSKMN